MQITIELSDKVARKLKALDALNGGITDAGEFFSSVLEPLLDREIRAHLSEDHEPLVDRPRVAPHGREELSIHDGLSHEEYTDDDDDGGDEDAPALTREMLEKDAEVEDPEHEALSADDDDTTFSEFLGVPDTEDDGVEIAGDEPLFGEDVNLEGAPRKHSRQVRRLPKNFRGKVEDFQGGETNSF